MPQTYSQTLLAKAPARPVVYWDQGSPASPASTHLRYEALAARLLKVGNDFPLQSTDYDAVESTDVEYRVAVVVGAVDVHAPAGAGVGSG